MLRSISLFTISLLCFGHAFSGESYFKHQPIYSNRVLNEVKIKYYVDEQKVGYISYTKIPIVPFYALHGFYVYWRYRNKGYGKDLLYYACNFLKSLGAQRMYIQPGPFEINEDGSVATPIASHALKLQLLIKLYKKYQFAFVNRMTSRFARLLYKCMSINEDTQYLMVKVIK